MKVSLGSWGATNSPAEWDLSQHPHGLVTGQTGSGKSYLLRWIIEQASQVADVWVADGKASGDFDDLEHERLASGPDDCVAMIEAAGTVMRDRNSGRHPRGNSPERRLLVVVDEAAALTIRVGGDSAKDGRERKDRLLGALGQVALMGRSARVHLLVSLQRADADVLGGAMRDQFGLRVALGWSSPDGYRMVLGDGQLQPPRTSPGYGWATGLASSPQRPVPLFVERDPQSSKRSWRSRIWPRLRDRRSIHPATHLIRRAVPVASRLKALLGVSASRSAEAER